MLAMYALAAAAAVSPMPGELKSFEDWAVGCDNVRRCTAISLMEMESGENQLTVAVTRGAARADPARLRIANIENRKSGAISLVIDGTTIVGTSTLKGDEAPFEIALSPVSVAKLKDGRTVELRDSDGASLGGASLRGMVAAFLYMDDRQARARTVTALITQGPLPESAVPPPPAPPVVAAHIRPKAEMLDLSAADMAKLKTRTGCEADTGQVEARQAFRLDTRTWLALVPCGAGAYNFTSVPVLISRGGVSRKMKIAEFDLPPGFTEAGGAPLLVNADWDSATGKLSSYAKGRGLGDCGSAETYVWDGRRFRLVSKIAMEECRGVIDWIPVWQANVIQR